MFVRGWHKYIQLRNGRAKGVYTCIERSGKLENKMHSVFDVLRPFSRVPQVNPEYVGQSESRIEEMAIHLQGVNGDLI